MTPKEKIVTDKVKKSARFYEVRKRNGKNEIWSYFVPGQNINSVKLDADQQHVATEVSTYGWFEVTVMVDPEGVYFSATINDNECMFRQGDEGFDYLTSYLKPEYDDACRIYNS